MRANRSHCSLQKAQRNDLLVLKERTSDSLFFCQKTRDLSDKPKSKFPTLLYTAAARGKRLEHEGEGTGYYNIQYQFEYEGWPCKAIIATHLNPLGWVGPFPIPPPRHLICLPPPPPTHSPLATAMRPIPQILTY